MPGVVRIGDDNNTHCASLNEMAEGSSTWFCDGLGVVRYGDATNSHDLPPDEPPCPFHSGNSSPPNRGWYVDGRLMAANMDNMDNCTAHAQGSSNWFLGS